MTGDIQTINTGAYAALPAARQTMLTNIKIMTLKDTQTAPNGWFPSGDENGMDAYAWLLESVVDDINIGLRTQYSGSNYPDIWEYVVQTGVIVFAIRSRISEFIEEPAINSLNLAYADVRDFVTRWKDRLNEIDPIYKSGKKNLRLYMRPTPAITVDTYHFVGGNSRVPIMLSALPSWVLGMRRRLEYRPLTILDGSGDGICWNGFDGGIINSLII